MIYFFIFAIILVLLSLPLPPPLFFLFDILEGSKRGTHVNTKRLDSISCPLGDKNCQRKGKHVVKAPSELEKNDGKCDGEASNAAHHGAGGNETVYARLDTCDLAILGTRSPDTP